MLVEESANQPQLIDRNGTDQLPWTVCIGVVLDGGGGVVMAFSSSARLHVCVGNVPKVCTKGMSTRKHGSVRIERPSMRQRQATCLLSLGEATEHRLCIFIKSPMHLLGCCTRQFVLFAVAYLILCLLYTSPSPRDRG